jgi:hypothetical protein
MFMNVTNYFQFHKAAKNCLNAFEDIHFDFLLLRLYDFSWIIKLTNLLFIFQWEAFCTPELNNFLRVLDREEEEYMAQLKYKYKVMKRLILTRMKELRQEHEKQKRRSMVNESTSW